MKVEIGSYYGNGNYGTHALRVDLGALALWFSYKTIVAFHEDGHCRVCRQNDWGPTTGKHLNVIEPDKKKRVSGEEFERRLSEVLKSHGLEI